jgi:hypothetical protein
LIYFFTQHPRSFWRSELGGNSNDEINLVASFADKNAVNALGAHWDGRAMPYQGVRREFEPIFSQHGFEVKSPSVVIGFLLFDGKM